MPVVLCCECGLVQTNPRMSEQAYRDYYNREYRILQDRESTPREAFAREEKRGRQICEFLDTCDAFPRPPSELSVVEVGCGSGGALHAFRERGCAVRGLDVAGGRGTDPIGKRRADVRFR